MCSLSGVIPADGQNGRNCPNEKSILPLMLILRDNKIRCSSFCKRSFFRQKFLRYHSGRSKENCRRPITGGCRPNKPKPVRTNQADKRPKPQRNFRLKTENGVLQKSAGSTFVPRKRMKRTVNTSLSYFPCKFCAVKELSLTVVF